MNWMLIFLNRFFKMAHHGLREDYQGFVDVYADGACLDNGFHGARAGIGVWFANNHYL